MKYGEIAVGHFISYGREKDELKAAIFLELKSSCEQRARMIEKLRVFLCQAIVVLEKEVEALQIQMKAKQNWMNLRIFGKLLPKQQITTR